jgi:glucose/mannose-6-phosphate isomerase
MSVNLDQNNIYERLDPNGMGVHIAGLPAQCRHAWKEANKFSLPGGFRRVQNIVVLGMGASGIGAELAEGLADTTKVKVTVIRGYSLPDGIDNRTLVIGSSYSGMTEETISAFTESLKTDCLRLVITTGGDLADLATKKNIPIFRIKYNAPPRAALAWSLIPLLVIFRQIGILKDLDGDILSMARLLDRLAAKYGTDSVTATNPAKAIARRMYGKQPVIYSAGFLGAAAQRWKTQINENSKNWAFYETFSELNHNAIEGYRFPASSRKSAYVVMLRSSLLDGRLLRRYEVTSDILRRSGVKQEEIDATGNDRLSQMMSLVYLGDWTSYYLAMLNGVDPSPVDRIAFLKKRLSAPL